MEIVDSHHANFPCFVLYFTTLIEVGNAVSDAYTVEFKTFFIICTRSGT